MSVAAFRSLVEEARRVGFAVRESSAASSVGPVAVSGMLAEQLVKELSSRANAGAVVIGAAEAAARAEVLVRIVAGDPTAEDEALVRAADAAGTPVVIVQLWPQAEWTKPFVLTPFVVECRTGQGFPLREIGDRIVEAAPNDVSLAARVPVLAHAARSGAIRSAVIRSGLIGLAGSGLGVSRPLLTLEQVRLLSRLRTTSGLASDDEQRLRVAGAAGLLAGGYAFRGVARSLRGVLPAPLVNAAVAAGGTWALATLAELAQAHLERPR